MIPRTLRSIRCPATVLGLLGMLGSACNNLPTVIQRPIAEQVAIIGGNCIVGSSMRVSIGGTCEVEAEARDGNGQVVVENFSWSTGDPDLATVSPKPGFDTIIADVSGHEVGLTTLRVEIAGRPDIVPDEFELTVFDPQQK